jgi:hypothetical protein
MPEPVLAGPLEEVARVVDEPVPELPVQLAPVTEAPSTFRQFDIPQSEQAKIAQRLAHRAQSIHESAPSELTWQEDGRTYTAKLSRVPTADSVEIDQVVADVITTNPAGISVHTQLTMRRLAFSQFTQVVDRWDTEVQLHDDEIIGRFHSNSPIFLGIDAHTAPRFLGRVTTAGAGFRITTLPAHGRRRAEPSQFFLGGLETHAGRIDLPAEARPFGGSPMDPDAHVLTFARDTHITFLSDGSCEWQSGRDEPVQRSHFPGIHPVYLVASRGAVLFVKGRVNGRVLIYSPEGVVIEGDLTYARDPRSSHDSRDLLGIVSDKSVEIAPNRVTGSGDLRIEAAIFARRRFVISDLDYPRTAKLSIYGSLTSGTISASEPRYSFRIEFDPRFETVRPPGFPSTDRYEVGEWQRTWNETTADAQP